MATVARFCARLALRAAAEEMETEAATEADILALVGVVEREARPARNPNRREKISSWISATANSASHRQMGVKWVRFARVPG